MRENREGWKNAVSHSSEKKHRRLFSAAVVLLVCCLAFIGGVSGTEPDGSEGNPYLIYTVEDFNEYITGTNVGRAGSKETGYTYYHYKLMNDLDFGYTCPANFKKNPAFYGIFDGNGKTISNISDLDESGTFSLFGEVKDMAEISNLSVSNVSVTVTVNGDQNRRYGTIAHKVMGLVSNCNVTDVTVTFEPDESVTNNEIAVVGGIFCNIHDGGRVLNCSVNNFTVIVNHGERVSSIEGIGGIGSQIVGGGTVTGCSVDNFVVYSNIQYINFFGVIVGRISGPCVVSDCLIGNVDASSVQNIGAFETQSYNLIYGRLNSYVENTVLTASGNEVDGPVNIAGVTGWALRANIDWYDEEGDYFEISTAEELAGLAKLVNLGKTFSGKTVVLTEDIDLEYEEWTPIGKSSETMFLGTFDGGYHAISNLMITGDNEGVGLFGYAANGGTIKNLIVKDAKVSGSQNVGSIVGNANPGTSFVNCTCSGELTTSNVQRIGGIIGVWNNTISESPVTLQNSTFSGSLSSTHTRGLSSLADFPNAGLVGECTADSGDGKLKFVNIQLNIPASKTGYTFKGWKGEETDPVFSPVTLNITRNSPLTEVWEKNWYTVTFMDGNTELTALEFEYESSVTAPANPTKDGYIFKGWSPELPETMPDENITVSAVWEMIPEEPTDEDETNHVIIITPPKTAWQVVFYPNGGEGSMNAEVFVEGEEEALPKNSFYRDGYVFKGWSLTPEGEVFYIDEETVVIDKTTYLYAVWEKIPDTPQTPEKPNIPTIPIIIAGIIVGLLVMILVITRKRQKEE